MRSTRVARLAACTLLFAAVSPAGAQTAAPAAPAAQQRLGPVAMFLQAMCIPWMGGVSAKTLADASEKRGFAPQWVGERLGGINAPEPLMRTGWTGVILDEQRKWCDVSGSYRTGARVDRIAAEIDAMAARATPEWRFVRMKPVKGQDGALPQYAWETATYTLTLHERIDDWAPHADGVPDALQVNIFLQKK
ncbi:MAG: hypothetical protein V4574_12735 [Pseudomonadota bacterium]